MHILYVFAHPRDPQSLNAVIRDQALAMLELLGHTTTGTDLYVERFRPVLDERDFPDRAVVDRFVPNIEIRHALTAGTVSPDIASALDQLRAAELVVFQFPLWWASVPAILKGWFDRVLSFAHAADAEGLSRPPLLRDKKAMLITTLEAPEAVYDPERRGGLRELLAPVTSHTLGQAGMTVLPTFAVFEATPDRPPDWSAAQVERLKAHLVVNLTGL